MDRRGFISGLIGIAAPAIIRTPGLLMPISRRFGAATYLPSRIHPEDVVGILNEESLIRAIGELRVLAGSFQLRVGPSLLTKPRLYWVPA